jgi:hypothetical protein
MDPIDTAWTRTMVDSSQFGTEYLEHFRTFALIKKQFTVLLISLSFSISSSISSSTSSASKTRLQQAPTGLTKSLSGSKARDGSQVFLAWRTMTYALRFQRERFTIPPYILSHLYLVIQLIGVFIIHGDLSRLYGSMTQGVTLAVMAFILWNLTGISLHYEAPAHYSHGVVPLCCFSGRLPDDGWLGGRHFHIQCFHRLDDFFFVDNSCC